MTEQEKAEAKREHDKASIAVKLLAVGMFIWAGQVFIDGGYTDQPEHHAMWRMVALLPAFWGLVLLVIFRYSWGNLIAALVMSLSGFYLAKAPTVGVPSTPRAGVRRFSNLQSTSRWPAAQLRNYCWDIVDREGRGDDAPCTQEEAEREAARRSSRREVANDSD